MGRPSGCGPRLTRRPDVAAQIKDKAVVHPILLAGPADQRQSSNPRSLMTMMSYEGAAGCVAANINVDGDDVDSYRGLSVEQCSVVTEYNDFNLKLRPAAGGPTTWIKLPKDGSNSDEIPLDIPIEVYVSTDIGPNGIWSYAWSHVQLRTGGVRLNPVRDAAISPRRVPTGRESRSRRSHRPGS